MNRRERILFLGAGGSGSNNFIKGFMTGIVGGYELFGANAQAEFLAASPLERNFLIPWADDPGYELSLIELIKDKDIDLIIPFSDVEVAKISKIRNNLNCNVFLPSDETIQLCQDKYALNIQLSIDIPVPKTLPIRQTQYPIDIGLLMSNIGGSHWWLRPRSGAGSKAATWVKTSNQAIAWIKLWTEIGQYKPTDFIISKFLPGRDYCFTSIWANGELYVAKLVERLKYFGGERSLSGMSSSPSIARTVYNQEIMEMCAEAVKIIDPNPHGMFSFDLKEDENYKAHITECNIGRPCMINPIFNHTGVHNMATVYVWLAFDEFLPIVQKNDVSEGWMLIRSIDNEPVIIHDLPLRHIYEDYRC